MHVREAAAWRGKEGEDEAGRGEMTAAVDGGGEAARGRAVTEEAASVRRLRARRRATWGPGFRNPSGRYFGSGMWQHPDTNRSDLEYILTVSLNEFLNVPQRPG